MLEAEKNVPASDVLVSNESPVEYENDVKTGKSNAVDQLNSKSHPEAHDNVVLEKKHLLLMLERMIWLCEFPKVKLEVTDSLIGKMPEPASPMFLINPSTANAREHSGEAFENIFAMIADCEDDEVSHEDQAAFLGNLGKFYWEKAMEFKPPRVATAQGTTGTTTGCGALDEGEGWLVNITWHQGLKALPSQGQVMTKTITTDRGHDHGSWEAPWSCLGQVLACARKGSHCLQHQRQYHGPWCTFTVRECWPWSLTGTI
ncbi:hypothetical protein MTR67_051738 [Solanum verrucosum]|uniref:Uncharacterized protein n=1 Tax=Solanum verrucosum TaxID=315347 RepID=A0AAF1A2E0_SOLVR|nr:hypothetical protein MTR67_051738 [Solanum verrucosum]